MLPLLLLLSLPQEAEPIEGGAQDAPSISTEALIEVGLPLERSRADLLPPAGALGRGWMMRKGELAFTVEQNTSTFKGMRDGTRQVDVRDLDSNWTQSRRATRSRWSLEGFYGWQNNVTLRAALPIETRSMNWSHDSVQGRTVNHGIGDVELAADFRLLETRDHRLVIGTGVLAPTGEADAQGSWPGANQTPPTVEVLLPYWLQLGSGVWQGLVNASWVHARGDSGWGAGLRGTVPLEDSESNWIRERALVADAWLAQSLKSGWIGSVRLQASGWSDVRRASDDSAGAMATDPLLDNARQGGNRLDASVGLAVDLSPPATGLTNRLEFSVGTPLWEDLDGPGPAAELHFAFRWRATL